jgi:hypothetical protein
VVKRKVAPACAFPLGHYIYRTDKSVYRAFNERLWGFFRHFAERVHVKVAQLLSFEWMPSWMRIVPSLEECSENIPSEFAVLCSPRGK